jgi:heat shock protein HspQ
MGNYRCETEQGSDQTISAALKIGDVVQDKTGAYYGVVVEMETASSSEEDL